MGSEGWGVRGGCHSHLRVFGQFHQVWKNHFHHLLLIHVTNHQLQGAKHAALFPDSCVGSFSQRRKVETD